MKMKKLLDLQLFAEDASAAGSDTETAEKNDNGAAAEQGKEAKTTGKAAEEKDEKKYSDADLDKIINKKFAQWQDKQQKAVDEAAKLATMNATQKAEYERDQLKKELDELKRKDSLAEMSKTARKILADDGINVSDELLTVLVSTDAEKTKAAVDGFKTAFKEAVEATVKERLKGEPPKKGTGGATSMTKEAIMAIKDPELRQQKMLENKHLFNF
jgi:hypothetical protein